ncbi:MAG: nitrilase-related carbon-nitrogen hydrolase [Patescibacteria group bacterium]
MVLNNKNNKKKFLFGSSALSGLLLAVSFSYSFFWILSFFAIIPYFYFLFNIKSGKKSFWGSFLFGFIYAGFITSWVWTTYPLDWAGVSSQLLGLATLFLAWLVITLPISLFISLFGLSFYFLKKRKSLNIFFVPVLWIVFDYLRAWFFTFLIYSPETFLGPHFSIGFVGYVLAQNYNFLQLASIGGVHILSFLVVFVNIFVFWLFFVSRFGRDKKIAGFVLLMLFLIVVAYFPIKVFSQKQENSIELTVSVVHTSFPSFFTITSEDRENRMLVYKDLVREMGNSEEKPDILIFPEDSRFLKKLMDNKENFMFFNDLFGGKTSMVIDSSRIKTFENKIKSRLFFYNVQTGEYQKYDKMVLAPGGEFLASFFTNFLKLIGYGDFVKKFNNGRAYTRGELFSTGSFLGHKVGGFFCNEVASLDVSKKITQNGAELLINPSSHSTFKGSEMLKKQILDITKVRAVENNRYVVQPGNFIPSSIISNKGEILFSSLDKDSFSVLNGKVKLINKNTFYSCFGDWVLLFLILWVVIIFNRTLSIIKFR